MTGLTGLAGWLVVGCKRMLAIGSACNCHPVSGTEVNGPSLSQPPVIIVIIIVIIIIVIAPSDIA